MVLLLYPDALPRNTATVLGVGTLLRRRETVDLARWSSSACHADLVDICLEKASEDDRMASRTRFGRDWGGACSGEAARGWKWGSGDACGAKPREGWLRRAAGQVGQRRPGEGRGARIAIS